jgi:poly(U)-specific endoribonuclease
MASDPNIYDRLWSADDNRCTVGVRKSDDEWTDATADLLVDHQVEAAGPRNIDLATRPLIHTFDESHLSRPTYAAFQKMLDNYLVNYRDPEDYTAEEKAEDLEFIGLAMKSEPMKLALEYVKNDLGKSVSSDGFAELMWKMWFEPYTNHFSGKSIKFCSGFEHVFVGEGKFDSRVGVARGEISGYHNWIKFYFDEKNDRVDFRGTKYDLKGKPEPRSAHVVTLQMVWNLMDTSGSVTAELFKKKGGFFLGTSPECEMAMGTVAMFESLQNLTVNQRRSVRIQGGNYNLVIYRETTSDGRQGDHIRSFYPEYLGDGLAVPEPSPGQIVVRPGVDLISNGGIIVIAEALVNPAGDDAIGEWVAIRNTSGDEIDLGGWTLADKQGRTQVLNGKLAQRGSLKIPIDRSMVGGVQLGNSGGRIQLIDRNGVMVASVLYTRTGEGDVIVF